MCNKTMQHHACVCVCVCVCVFSYMHCQYCDLGNVNSSAIYRPLNALMSTFQIWRADLYVPWEGINFVSWLVLCYIKPYWLFNARVSLIFQAIIWFQLIIPAK